MQELFVRLTYKYQLFLDFIVNSLTFPSTCCKFVREKGGVDKWRT